MSQKVRWARNARLAKYAGVSAMTVWRWKRMPDFPPAAVVNGIEYRDLDAFDSWMSGFVARRDAKPTRGQCAVKNLRREAGAAAATVIDGETGSRSAMVCARARAVSGVNDDTPERSNTSRRCVTAPTATRGD
jgi:hypothetical protein